MLTWHEYKQRLKSISIEDQLVMDILNKLQAERLKRGISQKNFARTIKMQQSQLAKLEQLDSLPTLKTLNRYANGLGLQVTLSVTPLVASGGNQ